MFYKIYKSFIDLGSIKTCGCGGSQSTFALSINEMLCQMVDEWYKWKELTH